MGQRDRDEALSFVAESLERFSFSDAPRIFSISARQALKAKQTQDREQLEGSGIQVFETELLRFLTEERAQSFLVNMYERTMTFLIQRSRSQEHPEYEDSYKAFIERFRDLRETVLGAASQEQEMISLEARADENSYPLQIDRKTGCQICGSILEAMFRFLSKYQYQLTVNPEIQQEHARRGGFCTLHTWQYESISSPYGVCVAYPELAHRLAAELKEFAGQIVHRGESIENIRGLLPTAKTCRVCEVRLEAEKRAVEEIAAAAQGALLGNALVPACCLSHLVLVTDLLGVGEPAQRLLESHAHLMERTAEDLQRYALRYDALRRYLTSEEERRASQLALLLLAGHRNVSAPWVIEYVLYVPQ